MIEALYIHIPFCDHICSYCDFPKLVIDRDAQDAYIRALIAELRSYGDDLGDVRTVYVGGGTPSWLKKDLWSVLMDRLRKYVDVSALDEFTVEANPLHIDPAWVNLWSDACVTRVSLGVQSMQTQTLATLGRRHTPDDVRHAIETLRKTSDIDVNLDFMHGVPGQSMADVRVDLDEIADLKPDHVSYYGLILEKGTILDHRLKKNIIRMPEDDLATTMIETVNDRLKRLGYRHYEISNFALKGKTSHHNLAYWRLKPYLGIGMGASSQAYGRRFKNDDTLDGYVKRVRTTGRGVMRDEAFDPAQEYVLLGLRTDTGIDKEAFRKRFGVAVFEMFPKLQTYVDRRHLVSDDKRLYLTESGMTVSNRIFLSLF